jgi:hypothetical protein
MRKLKQLCTATAFALALSFTAFAGNMDTPTITSPPPLNQPMVTGSTDTTNVASSDTSNSETVTTDSVKELTLYLFESMMFSVF